jgi:hypothetical protein
VGQGKTVDPELNGCHWFPAFNVLVILVHYCGEARYASEFDANTIDIRYIVVNYKSPLLAKYAWACYNLPYNG